MKDVNLVPREILEKEFLVARARVWSVLVVLFALLIGASVVYLNVVTNRVEKSFSRMHVRVENEQSLTDELDRSREERDRLEAKEKIIRGLLEKRAWCRVFHDIVENIDDDVWLVHISDTEEADTVPPRQALQIRGFAISNRHLADFMTRLNRLPYMDQVELKILRSAEREGMEVVEFDLECQFVEFPRARMS